MTVSAEQEREISRLLQFRDSTGQSLFNVLGVPADQVLSVTTADITKIYRRLTPLLHPDKCPHPQAAEAFHILHKAYNALSQEPVLRQLQRAEEKRRAKNETAAAAAAGRERIKREREEELSGQRPPLGKRCCLAPSGISTTEQKTAEIQRVLACAASDYFGILDVDPEADGGDRVPPPSSSSSPTETGESSSPEEWVRKRYRKVAQALHPDKCQLPNAVDAFQRVERAYQELQDPKKFIRYKAGFQQQRKKEEALRRSGWGAGGLTSGVSSDNPIPQSMEERQQAALREQMLEAARLAEMAAQKKRKIEQEEAEKAKLSAELERQRREWKDLMI